MLNTAVNLDSVSKRFGKIRAVNALSLEIPEGTVYGLLGPNGSGKSTTMKLIMGLLKPDSGQITVCGMDPQKEPLNVKRVIGYVPETPRLYEFLTGMEYLDFIAAIHGIPTEQYMPKVNRFLKAFELSGHENKMIGGYSHGMKQKTAIIGALLGDPELLVLDEPLGGLDPKSARIMKDLLHTLAEEGVTTIFSTHVLEIAEAICDKICILYKGNLLTEGTAEELKGLSDTPDSTLEEAFLKLTNSSDVREIVEALAY